MFRKVISWVVMLTLIITSFSGFVMNVDAEVSGSGPELLAFEAEAADNELGGSSTSIAFTGASGGKAAALSSAAADYIIINNVNVTGAGDYSLYVHYATTEAAIGIITANGTAPETVEFASTASGAISAASPWSEQGGTAALPVTLAAGSNSIKIAMVSGSVYMDKIEIDTATTSFEAESPCNTLVGGGSTSDNSKASGRKQVNNFSETGGIIFGDINVENTGRYILTLYYCTKDPRNFKLIVNHGTPIQLDCPSTSPDSWDTIGTFKTEVELVKGKNSLEFYSFDYGPNLDKITLNAAAIQDLPPYPPYEGTLYEAEDQVNNTIEGTIEDNIFASGGKYVINLGSKALTFNNITVDEDGYYKVAVLYSVGDNTRSFNLSVNGGAPIPVAAPSTLFWDKIGKVETVVSLRAGTNTLKFDNAVTGWAPNLDAIAVAPGAAAPAAPASGDTYEAEKAILSNGAEIQGNAKASNALQVGKLGDPSSNGSVSFENVYIRVGGSHTVTIFYVSGSEDRAFEVSINGEAPIRVACPKSGDDWAAVGTVSINAVLNQGNNTIKFDNPTGYAPNLDKIVVDNRATVYEAESSQNVLGGNASISLNSKASSGVQIGNLGGDKNGSLKFTNVYASKSGNYLMKVDYASGSERAFDISINELPAMRLICPAVIEDDWETVGAVYLTVALVKGSNTVKFDNKSGYSPNLDRISVIQGVTSYEAESPGNTLGGGAAISGDSAEDSGRRHVGDLGGSGNGSVRFNNVNAAAAGTYKLTAYYISGSDDRYFTVNVNNASGVRMSCPNSGGWSEVGKIETLVELNEGVNTIEFGSDYYAPNLDKIEISEWPVSYEGEDNLNTIAGGATIDGNPKDSGGKHAGNLGDGFVQFNHVNVSKAGEYKMKVFYVSGSDDRSFDISVNGLAAVNFPCPRSDADWSEAAWIDVAVQLNQGDNTIRFGKAGGYAPNLDRIEICTVMVASVKSPHIVTLANGNVKLEYDLNSGTADFYHQNVKKIAGFFSSAQTYRLISSRDYTKRTAVTNGNETVITCEKSGYPAMKQKFILEGDNYFLAEVTLEGTALSSNWMSPVMTDSPGSVDIGSYDDNRALFVPFDNDAWIRYNAGTINRDDMSYEVSAFYNNANRNGLVVGSATHDTWKTGIVFKGAENTLDRMYAFGGAASAVTRDRGYHGRITGDSITSPGIFVGYYSDWRSGMEEFAKVNAAQAAKLEWDGGVPFGWNSWGKIQSSINLDKAIGVSNFIHDELQNNGFSNDNTVYINLDSYWDNMNDSQLAQFVQNCKNNGQRAGIYWAPFVDWGKNAARQVENTGYNYREIWLKDSNGNPVELDGAYALDPTHPGTRARIDYFIDRFKNAGFEYIKLDFLTHGSIEGGANNGTHYDTGVKTGIQAYNQGMQYVNDRIGGTMFISLAISPVFPYQYAHARRVACDSYGAIHETEYTMNSAAYGWWMSGTLYRYNDPDHMLLEGYTSDENMSRVTSGVVAGTVFLDGDDLTGQAGQELAERYLTNANVNAVAKLGKPFVAAEGNSGTGAADTFVLKDGNTAYVAVFNFSSSSVTKALNFRRLGLEAAAKYDATELWSGTGSTFTGSMEAVLNPKGVKLYKLTVAADKPSDGNQPDNPPSGGSSSSNSSPGSSAANNAPSAGTGNNNVKTVKDANFANSIKEAIAKNKPATLRLQVTGDKGEDSFSILLPAELLGTQSKNIKIRIDTPIATVIAPTNLFASDEIAGKTEVSLNIKAVRQAGAASVKPVVEIGLTVDGKAVKLDNPEATITVKIPYAPTPEEAENYEHLVVYIVDEAGRKTPVPGGRYNARENTVDFKTTVTGKFAVEYTVKSFDDIDKVNWAKKPIEVLASKGIVAGTSEKNFSPKKTISRGEFLNWLVASLGLKARVSSNFSDIDKNRGDYEAIGIAKVFGITSGTGNNKFDPEKEISRQEMMVLTAKALKVAGCKLETGTMSDIGKFGDGIKVSSYAQAAVSTLVRSGYIVGSDNMLNPASKVTRAEAASMVYIIYFRN